MDAKAIAYLSVLIILLVIYLVRFVFEIKKYIKYKKEEKEKAEVGKDLTVCNTNAENENNRVKTTGRRTLKGSARTCRNRK